MHLHVHHFSPSSHPRVVFSTKDRWQLTGTQKNILLVWATYQRTPLTKAIFKLEVISSSTRPTQHFDSHLCRSSALNPTGLWPLLSLCRPSVHLYAVQKLSQARKRVGGVLGLKISYITQDCFITEFLLHVSAQTNSSGSV